MLTTRRAQRSRFTLAVTCGLVVTVATGCSGSSADTGTNLEVRAGGLLNFTLPKLAEGFRQTGPGKGVNVNGVLGGTTTMTHQVNQGADHPDLMLLTSVEDRDALERAHNAQTTSNVSGSDAWSSSPMTLLVRKGNPKHIRSWNDLARSDVKILTLDPGTAGAGRWAVAAVYGAGLRQTHSHAQAMAYTRKVIRNAARWPTGFSADAPPVVFASGVGDVMLVDEGAAVSVRKAMPDMEYIVPPTTLRVTYPWALLTDAKPQARSFMDYIGSSQGQQVMANMGWRPKSSEVHPTTDVVGAMDPKNPYPAVKDMFTIGDIGGWAKLNQWLFDGPTALMQTQ